MNKSQIQKAKENRHDPDYLFEELMRHDLALHRIQELFYSYKITDIERRHWIDKVLNSVACGDDDPVIAAGIGDVSHEDYEDYKQEWETV